MVSRSSWLLMIILFDLLLVVGVVQAQTDSTLYLPGIVQVEQISNVQMAGQVPGGNSSAPNPQTMSRPHTTQRQLFWFCSTDVERVIGQRLAMFVGCR